MAHNFVEATKAQFGWEMIGWSIGTEVTAKVANNPIQTKRVRETRNEQAKTFKRYVELGYRFPKDISPNLCDRIHAHILFLCKKKYGPNFWSVFFREIRKESQQLIEATAFDQADENRNKRYQITIECFDQLEGLDFKNMLKEFQISLTTDVKSLHPAKPGWNRKFI
jgi:predicted Zn-dependent peptidase